MLRKMSLLILKLARIAAWSLAVAIVVLSLVPPVLRPETGVPHNLEHFLIFVTTGATFGLAYDVRLALLTTELASFAGAVEIAQLLVPGRHARLSDFAVDAVSICAGAIAGSLARRALWIIDQVPRAPR